MLASIARDWALKRKRRSRTPTAAAFRQRFAMSDVRGAHPAALRRPTAPMPSQLQNAMKLNDGDIKHADQASSHDVHVLCIDPAKFAPMTWKRVGREIKH